MAKNRTSITERLKKSRNSQARRDYAHDWADEWERRYVHLLLEIQRQATEGNEDKMIALFGDLRGLMQPKFNALHNVIDELIYPTRELQDD